MALKNKYEIALEVWRGAWGSSTARYNRLKKAGYDPDEIQNIVNSYSVKQIEELAEKYKAQPAEPSCETLEVRVNLKKYGKIMLIFEE